MYSSVTSGIDRIGEYASAAAEATMAGPQPALPPATIGVDADPVCVDSNNRIVKARMHSRFSGLCTATTESNPPVIPRSNNKTAHAPATPPNKNRQTRTILKPSKNLTRFQWGGSPD